jgi:phosphoribosylaminoimidazole-succinocarboxamide synthase
VSALVPLHSGKVRDLFAVGEDLLLVASDRLSAFDVVMAEPIPDKGRVLTAMTHYWVREAVPVPTALLTCDPTEIRELAPEVSDHPEWAGRMTLARRAQMVPLECIVRARLAGQAFEEYAQSGTIHSMAAPAGLRLADPLPEPIFTPSTKAAAGHDVNISLDEAAALVGRETLEGAEALSLTLFARAAAALEAVGLVLADTKFELGFVEGRLVVCDEVVTPDSSRIWPAEGIVAGVTPPSFDKQPFRDWLSAQPWDRTPPPPRVPTAIVAETAARYVECYERVTGRSLDDWYGAGS